MSDGSFIPPGVRPGIGVSGGITAQMPSTVGAPGQSKRIASISGGHETWENFDPASQSDIDDAIAAALASYATSADLTAGLAAKVTASGDTMTGNLGVGIAPGGYRLAVSGNVMHYGDVTDVGVQGHRIGHSDSNLNIINAGGSQFTLSPTSLTCNVVMFAPEVIAGYHANASDPTTLDIASGHCRRWKNTTSGEIRDWVNDAGVMRKSAAYT